MTRGEEQLSKSRRKNEIKNIHGGENERKEKTGEGIRNEGIRNEGGKEERREKERKRKVKKVLRKKGRKEDRN